MGEVVEIQERFMRNTPTVGDETQAQNLNQNQKKKKKRRERGREPRGSRKLSPGRRYLFHNPIFVILPHVCRYPNCSLLCAIGDLLLKNSISRTDKAKMGQIS